MVLTLGPLAISAHAEAAKVPAEISSLWPKSAAVKGDYWDVMPTEFGKTFGGGMHAGFPGFPLTCDNTVGSELTIDIKGDTAWEQPPMLDMAIELHNSDIQKSRTSLPAFVASLQQANSGVQSTGKLVDESLPAGQLIYIEYMEKCSRHSGAVTVLRGYSRKGATMLDMSLVLTKPAAEARALAAEVLGRFQKLDTANLVK